MAHLDPTLKQYADNGFRTAADWLNFGREVPDGTAPRAEANHLREPIPLYTRDQTRTRPRVVKSKPVKPGV